MVIPLASSKSGRRTEKLLAQLGVQTDTAEPFPGRNDTHATSRQRNDTLTSSPSMPPIPTRNGPYFAKQNRDDAPPAVPPPNACPNGRPGTFYGRRLSSPFFIPPCNPPIKFRLALSHHERKRKFIYPII